MTAGQDWLIGGVLMGAVIACWNYVRGFIWRAVSFLVEKTEIHDMDLSQIVMSYLMENYKRFDIYDRTYNAMREHVKSRNNTGIIPYEWFGYRSLILWNGWQPFLVCRTKEKENPDNEHSQHKFEGSYCTILCIRGSLDVDKIIGDATIGWNDKAWDSEAEDEKKQRRFFIRRIPEVQKSSSGPNPSSLAAVPWYFNKMYRVVGYKPEDLGEGSEDNDSVLEQLIFPKRVVDLIEEIKMWRTHRDWYEERNIPWKRGWLLYGPPGTGKTALARAFAEDLDLPVYVYNLSELGNMSFQRAWLEMQSSVPCIALIEDIDNVFHGRKNVAINHAKVMMTMFSGTGGDGSDDDDEAPAPGGMRDNAGGLTFDCLLNVLDGVEKNEGIFTIVTTNDISKIDEALGIPRQRVDGSTEVISTRPGRIDKAIELTYMEDADKKIMATKILSDFPAELAKMFAFVDNHVVEKETPAQFQDRCAQVALRCLWDRERK